MNKYQQGKECAREKAIEWQSEQKPKSWLELANEQEKFERLAKRYGLVKEFRENGII